MDEIKKENFDLKLRVSLLQERLSKSAPENIEGALNEVKGHFMMTRSILIMICLERRIESKE